MRLLLVRHGDAHAGFHGVIGGRAGLCRADRPRTNARPRHCATASPDPTGWRADVLLASVAAPCDRDGVDHRTGPGAGDRWPGVRPVRGPHRRSRRPDLDRVRRPLRVLRHGGRARPGLRAGRATAGTASTSAWSGSWRRLAVEYEGRTVVAVCHAGVIMASMRLLLGHPARLDERPAPADQHRADGVGARPVAGPVVPAHLQRRQPPARRRRLSHASGG